MADIHGDDMMAPIINRHNEKSSSSTSSNIDIYNDRINPRRYFDELPEDLWIQIFSRFPVKSLLLVMCVCKHWYNLIKDPSFTGKHLQFQKTASEKTGHLLFLHEQQISGTESYNYFLFDGESLANVRTSSFSLQASRNLLHISREDDYFIQFKIDGPVNGLYCLHNTHGSILIWNPATNEIGFLPIPHTCLPAEDNLGQKRILYSGVVGFGTDPLDEENYKVALITDCTYDDSNLGAIYVMLYTTRTNTWRHIDDYITAVVEPMNNTYLNGLYYWMDEWSCKVLVFDMSEKEAFRYISAPCHGNLVLYSDRIYLFGFDRFKNPNEFDIWVMTEKNNWLKIKSVVGLQSPMMNTLGFWKSENDLLIVIDDSNDFYDAQTVLYNTTTRKIRNIVPRGISCGFKAIVYYESLVSLNGEITKAKADDVASLSDIVRGFLKDEPVVSYEDDEYY